MNQSFWLAWFLLILLFIGACITVEWAARCWWRWKEQDDRRIADRESQAHRVTVDLRKHK